MEEFAVEGFYQVHLHVPGRIHFPHALKHDGVGCVAGQTKYSSGNRKIQIRSTTCQYRPPRSTGVKYFALKSPRMPRKKSHAITIMPMMTWAPCKPVMV